MPLATPYFQDELTETIEKPPHFDAPLNMNRVAAIILGGGQGTRLYPLTKSYCKPAIWFGGRYRLIDVPVSNSLNSNINKIFIVTQFLSLSLHRHIIQTYHPDSFSSGFIDILAAEQKPEKSSWFQGTADAIRQSLEYLVETPCDYFLILSGDQLYHMDFTAMVQTARRMDVDLLVATLPVNEEDAKRMGIMKVNEDHHIVDFYEKPKDPATLQRMRTSPSILDSMGLEPSSDRSFLGSMGIYLFKRQALLKLLNDDPRDDFGHHLIPTKVKQGKIGAFPHNGYWEDIGTIESFHKANIALTLKTPHFDFYDEANPIYTSRSILPGPKIYNTHVKESIICEGSIIEADEISHSILGQRSVIGKGSILRNSYIMGNEYYQPPVPIESGSLTPLTIGADCVLENCILDKNVTIGRGVRLLNLKNEKFLEGPYACIRDGIIVVPRGSVVPDGFTL